MGMKVRGGAESSIQWAQAAGMDQEQPPIGFYAGGGASVSQGRVEEQVYVLEQHEECAAGMAWRMLMGMCKGLGGLHSLESGIPRVPSSSLGKSPRT